MSNGDIRALAAEMRPDSARSDVYAVSNAQLDAWADKLESLAGEWAVVPRVPTPGLLMSMAIRYDHALGIPGFYDEKLFGKAISEFTHAQRLESTLSQMRQLHEEVVGTGFYAPEREQQYSAMIEAAERQETK